MAMTSTLLPLALPGGQYSASSSDSGGGMSDSQAGGRHRVRTVTLSRRRHCPALGFSLRGGREHGTGFFVSAVEPGSEAHAHGLQAGDQIIRINGFPVEDATHREVFQLIQGQTSITLKVRSVGMIPVKDSYNDALTWKLVESDCSLVPTSLSSNQSDVCDEHPALQSQNDVRMVLHVAPRAKLGCGICKGPEWRPGIFVQFTKENGLARGAGLRPGDQILQCNNISLTPDTPFNEAVSVLRGSGLLELVVRKGAGLDLFPGESSGYNSSASSVAGDQSPETWLNKRLSIVKEESIIDSESRLSHNDLNKNYLERREVQANGSLPCSSNKSTNTESTCTVIRVGPDETAVESNRRSDSSSDSHKNKLAEICIVSQQTETKTTTVLVEVHQSEEETSTGCKSENTGLLNSSSVSSFTSSSSNSNSLSSAISQELQRRSQRRASDSSEIGRTDLSGTGRNLELVRSGLDKEKVQQHEQLMEEFRMAHKRMFSPSTSSSSSTSSSTTLDIEPATGPLSVKAIISERESIRAQEQKQQQQQQQQQQQLKQQQLQQQKQQPLQPQQQQKQQNLPPKQHLPVKQQAPPPPPPIQLHQQNHNHEKSQYPVQIKEQSKITNNNLALGTTKTTTVLERELPKQQLRNRQQHYAPPPPPPLPTNSKDESDGSAASTVKLSSFLGGKRPAGSTIAILSPPSPPACPTPDYDTMSVASEQDLRRPIHRTEAMRSLVNNRNVNGNVGKSKSSVIVNGKCPNADCVEMESLESFKLTNPSTVRPKPPATYFAQNRKSSSRSSESSLNRVSVQNVAVEGAKPTITIREYPTTLDRKNPSRFQFLNQNVTAPVVPRDQPISSQLQDELSQTLSRVKLQSSSNIQPETTTVNGTGKTNVVTICVNTKQKPQQQPSNSQSNSTEQKSQGGPFYLFPRKNPTDEFLNHSKMVSTTLISKSDLQEVDLKKSNSRYSDNVNKNSVTFNFGNNEKTESRAINVAQPNGILKNGSNGNISQVQIHNLNPIPNHRLPQQKTIKFGGITTIIQNSPEPKM